uniref:hypothetical protein n=1 Tax=Trichocoleus desertorum TaxID=1481672 RepID=UPI0025B2B33E|nr:hypothetical protein [Trichocoleus desertorum]
MELLEYLEELEDRVQILLPLVGEYLDQYLSLEQVDKLLMSADEPQQEEYYSLPGIRLGKE